MNELISSFRAPSVLIWECNPIAYTWITLVIYAPRWMMLIEYLFAYIRNHCVTSQCSTPVVDTPSLRRVVPAIKVSSVYVTPSRLRLMIPRRCLRRSCNIEFRHFLTMKRCNVDCFDKSQRSLYVNRFTVAEAQLNFEQVSQRDDCLFSKWSSLINYSNNSSPHLNILAIVLLYQRLSIDKLLVSGIVKIHEYTICTYFYLPSRNCE